MKKRSSSEFYTTTDESGQIVVHDYAAEIAAKHAPPPVSSEQLDAWKKQPKEQATKKILELIDDQSKDVSEKRFELDALKTVAEIQGASAPPPQGSTAPIMIIINQPGDPRKRRIVNVTPPLPSSSQLSSEEAEQESTEKKEDAPP